MKRNPLKIIYCIVLLVFTNSYAHAQADSSKSETYENLSLKDLLQVKIVSVSKTAESVFDAPLSASVLTRAEIIKSGCTSIMEALRLVPGMIVREQSNGNYDIHLRGMDNVPPNAPFDVVSNTTTLIMIDDRPVYSYLRGGTFWETLPVDLNDVEKIEVIRGPAAALYGPNAVNGVINIITRQLQKDGLYLVANVQQGSNLTFINNISAGYRFSKKLSVIASGNYQSRDRVQNSYFEFNRNEWLDTPSFFINFTGDTVRNIAERYPDPSLAMDKYAGNIFVHYAPANKMKFDLSTGIQHSMVQKVSTENEITPFSTAVSGTHYADFRAAVNAFSAQFSWNSGKQTTDNDAGRKYNFSIASGTMEYKFTKNNFSLTPGIGYTSAVYDDREYSDLIKKNSLLNARGQITTKTASLRSEYKMLGEKLRLVAGFAINKFNHPDTGYLSYEFAPTYRISKNQIIRVVFSRSPRSPNIFDTYATKTIAYYPTGIRNYARVALEGNENTKLLTADMLELGYRANISRAINLDVELFHINAKNYATPVSSRSYTQVNGTDTITVQPVRSTNIPLTLQQFGATVSVAWTTKKIYVKPFITIQHTTAKNYAPFLNTPDATSPNASQNNIYSGMGNSATLESTPAIFGGASLNYTLTQKLNINLYAYYYSAQTYYHVSNVVFNDGTRGIDHINAKLILNASVSYEAAKGLRFFCSGKNILNDNSREYFKTDAVPFMLLGGIHYEL
ncbi:MAG: TonB-dependent receptor plug domain-containing protein [Chitinophagaceae bacterium]